MTRPNPTIMMICIDANCPKCGYPERWAKIMHYGTHIKWPFELIEFGCNKCEYRSKERNA